MCTRTFWRINKSTGRGNNLIKNLRYFPMGGRTKRNKTEQVNLRVLICFCRVNSGERLLENFKRYLNAIYLILRQNLFSSQLLCIRFSVYLDPSFNDLFNFINLLQLEKIKAGNFLIPPTEKFCLLIKHCPIKCKGRYFF